MIISPIKANEAAGVLELDLETLTPEAIKLAFRNKAKECHPDHHGTEKLQAWARVSWAKEVLERYHKQNPRYHVPPAQEVVKTGGCRACGGSGRVKVRRAGFGGGLTMHCVMCDGSGEVTPKEVDGGD